MARRQAKKRKLTKEEIERIRKWIDDSPQGRKPSIRQIARALGVNRPSIIKSLGGWKGIQRGRPEPPKKPKTVLDTDRSSPIRIEPFTTEIPELDEKTKAL